MTKLKNKTVILNKSEGSMNSSAKAFRMINDSGRSMVEMLGVLAVIGVLSIAGVAGYTTAMNKHRANEILNGASVRAVMVSTKLQKSSTVDIANALAEFGTESVQGVTYGTPAKVGDNQFKIPLTGLSDKTEICSQMKNIAGENGSGIVLVESDCSRLLYNNDLSTGVTNTNNRDANDTTKCTTGYKGTDCDECDTGYTPDNKGRCQSAGTPFKKGLIKGQYNYSAHNPDYEPYSFVLCTHSETPKADNLICPSGYRWAGYDDVKNLGKTYIASIFSDVTVCEDCSSEYAFWLNGTFSTKPCRLGYEGITIEENGEISSRDEDDDYQYALCIKN